MSRGLGDVYKRQAGIGMNVLQVKTAMELSGNGSVWKIVSGHTNLMRMVLD